MSETTEQRILIVDDRPESRYATGRILKRAGFFVLEASTGREALKRVQEDSPDLVILDVHLPDMNGFEVCRQIKSSKNTASIPVLHLSASFVESQDKVQGLDSGADAYLTQPVQPNEMIATVRALLRAHRAEEKLRRMNEQLAEQAQALRNANDSLERANLQLAEADRRKDEFLAMLAHELRNPLAPIQYALQMLDGSDHVSSDQMERMRKVIQRQVTHMSRLLDDLLDVSRVTQGKIQLHREIIDLNEVAGHAVDSCSPMCEIAGQRLEFTRWPLHVRVNGDPTRLEQVLRNVLHNAHKYTGEGGVIQVRVSVLEDEPPVAQVTVSDNGMGIPQPILPYIFEPFVQADQTLAHTQGGLGIGLAMVKHLILLHGGTVGAESTGVDGAGSCFTICLPMASSTMQVQPQQTRTTEFSAAVGGHRILVVEDNRDSANSLRELLEMWGHQAMVTADGPEALKLLDQWIPQIVLLDIGLPGMSGYDVARQMRTDPRTSSACLIALTGYGTDDDRLHAREAGFDEHLTKPVDIEQFQILLSAYQAKAESAAPCQQESSQ